MIILAAFLPSNVTNHPGVCTEPHIRPFSGHFGGTLMTFDDTKMEMLEILDLLEGRRGQVGPGAGNATIFTYTPDLITMDELGTEGEFTCTLHPRQFLRMLCQFYKLQTEGIPSLMEVEMLSYKPYTEEYPIPPAIRSLPLIKLEDPIELPALWPAMMQRTV